VDAVSAGVGDAVEREAVAVVPMVVLLVDVDALSAGAGDAVEW